MKVQPNNSFLFCCRAMSENDKMYSSPSDFGYRFNLRPQCPTHVCLSNFSQGCTCRAGVCVFGDRERGTVSESEREYGKYCAITRGSSKY